MESIDERDFFIKGYKIDRAKLLANFGSTEKDPENVRFLELWKHFPEPFLYIAPGEEPEGNLSLVVVLADGDDKDALEQVPVVELDKYLNVFTKGVWVKYR